MNIKSYKSNIEITFADGRDSITLYSDNYLNLDEKTTEAEEREYLSETYDLSEEELDSIIETLQTNEWID